MIYERGQWTLLETSSYDRRYAILLAVFAVEEDHIERAQDLTR